MARRKSERKPASLGEAVGFKNIFNNEKINFILGAILLGLAIYIIIAFSSYFSTGEADQSQVIRMLPNEWLNTNNSIHNYCGSMGAVLSNSLIAENFGIPAFLLPFFMILASLQMMNAYKVNLWKWFFGTMLVMVWSSVAFAKFLSPIMTDSIYNPGGEHGRYCCQWLENVIGAPGLIAILTVTALAFLTYLSSETIIVVRKILNPSKLLYKVPFVITNIHKNAHETRPADTAQSAMSYDDPAPQTVEFPDDGTTVVKEPVNTDEIDMPIDAHEPDKTRKEKNDEIDMTVEAGHDTQAATGSTLVSDDVISTPINPKEPFTSYQYPTLDLLNRDANAGRPYIDEAEQTANKNRIIEVLRTFGVEIKSIRATVGPTVTLYEIKPADGVKISRIRNLEDDIALSLAAIGIRIIAPIPGKGTIGIEVPNAKPNIVSMESVLNSRKFQETKMELPIALGKTITNDVFMEDLTKIPHLLVAGATGQGKSVGLNAIITSLLYKKHPNELKFVLIDPKKVEFSVYAPIADHFIAKVPDDDDEPIITDVTKVVKTLRSLCTLMDHRYDMLKLAGARNIKEYNAKFVNHQLDLTKGHEFMPYIVVIIDEFGDLIMTAGKEIELPIARIAQLARAVGIHMIIATQRPTTTIITGNIKANFPGRIAFKVSAAIDSRTILDRTGANQLIGRGDMLYSKGNDPVRVQCAFVDTPEVERINEYIAHQPGPVEPMWLPEPATDDESSGGGNNGLSMTNLDPRFEEIARFVVLSQQGSTSMIQRKYSIGYNRAGRLMDQLEKAGIVGAARGSKPREVLITDENSLDSLLAQLK